MMGVIPLFVYKIFEIHDLFKELSILPTNTRFLNIITLSQDVVIFTYI